MNFRCITFLHLAFAIFGSALLLAEDRVEFTYQPVITAQDHFNSKGVLLTDPAAILAQERLHTHKAGAADEEYFTTPQRRAEIPEMLARGSCCQHMKRVILTERDPLLQITVRRDHAGNLAMHVDMRPDDQANCNPEIFEIPSCREAKNFQNRLESLRIPKTDPDFHTIYTALSDVIRHKVGEPVKLDLSVHVLGRWARVDGNISTMSGKEPINEETAWYFELELTAVLKKTEDRWQVLKHVVAGDISAAIEIPEAFPDVPEALFHRFPQEPISGVQPSTAKSVERMIFIDEKSNFRSGPSIEAPIKFQPIKGTVGSVIERRGNWIKIQLEDEDSGWVHKQNLRSVK